MSGATAKRRRGSSWAAVAFFLLVMGHFSVAQSESLPSEILNAETLTDAQKQDVSRFASAQVQQMVGSQSTAASVAARDSILNVLNDSRAKPAVKSELAKALAAPLAPAMDSPVDRTRLFAMALASRLAPADGFAIYLKGLSDKTAGVRYLAAKSLALATGAGLPQDQQGALLASLAPAMGKETAGPAFEQMTRVMTKLTVPEATGEAIAALRAQVAVAVGGLTYSQVVGVNKTLEHLEKTISQQPAGQSEAAMRELAAVGAQYLMVVAQRMVGLGSEPDDSLELACIDLVQTIDQKVLAAAVRQLGGGVQGPPLYNLARQKQWGEMGLNALKWVGDANQPGILSSAPLSIPFDKLKLP